MSTVVHRGWVGSQYYVHMDKKGKTKMYFLKAFIFRAGVKGSMILHSVLHLIVQNNGKYE